MSAVSMSQDRDNAYFIRHKKETIPDKFKALNTLSYGTVSSYLRAIQLHYL